MGRSKAYSNEEIVYLIEAWGISFSINNYIIYLTNQQIIIGNFFIIQFLKKYFIKLIKNI